MKPSQRQYIVNTRAAYPFLGSFESTKIHGTGKDILATTHHIQRWEYDLNLLYDSGIRELRYPAPWHRIERSPEIFDFTWIDGPMNLMRQLGMRPIIDLLHHTSFPDWLTGGFSNPDFPNLYARFVDRFAERYPWADRYTVFNEPLPTTLFCSQTGLWYPHGQSDQEFVRMALLVCRAISLATGLLSKRDSRIQFVHVDTCEVHRALDSQSKAWVEFANHRRFLMHDLILGRVRRDHRLWGYLTGCGAREDELRLLEGNPARFDILGLDYYIHSEMEWQWDDDSGCSRIVHPCERADGFATVARAYGSRYGVPVMLCETNIRGSVTDRLTWLKFMSEQVEQLAAAGVDVRGFCWFPSIDSTDWCHVCTRSTGSVDPQGIWSLDEGRWARRASKLSTVYSQLCRGRVSTNDLPAYRFNEPLSEAVRGFGHLMSHWAYPGADNDSEMAA